MMCYRHISANRLIAGAYGHMGQIGLSERGKVSGFYKIKQPDEEQ